MPARLDLGQVRREGHAAIHEGASDGKTYQNYLLVESVATPKGPRRVASRIRASRRGVSFVAECPQCRLYRPGSRSAAKRRVHRAM
jgi:hypothetical protein